MCAVAIVRLPTESRYGRLLPAKWGIAGVGKAEWVASTPSAQGLVQRSVSRRRKKPVAALLDEAHTLDAEVGQVLLNASRRSRQRPVPADAGRYPLADAARAGPGRASGYAGRSPSIETRCITRRCPW